MVTGEMAPAAIENKAASAQTFEDTRQQDIQDPHALESRQARARNTGRSSHHIILAFIEAHMVSKRFKLPTYPGRSVNQMQRAIFGLDCKGDLCSRTSIEMLIHNYHRRVHRGPRVAKRRRKRLRIRNPIHPRKELAKLCTTSMNMTISVSSRE